MIYRNRIKTDQASLWSSTPLIGWVSWTYVVCWGLWHSPLPEHPWPTSVMGWGRGIFHISSRPKKWFDMGNFCWALVVWGVKGMVDMTYWHPSISVVDEFWIQTDGNMGSQMENRWPWKYRKKTLFDEPPYSTSMQCFGMGTRGASKPTRPRRPEPILGGWLPKNRMMAIKGVHPGRTLCSPHIPAVRGYQSFYGPSWIRISKQSLIIGQSWMGILILWSFDVLGGIRWSIHQLRVCDFLQGIQDWPCLP